MKNTISELKNTVEGIKSKLDEAENQISELEDKVEKNSQTEQKKEKRFKKNEERLWLVWLSGLSTGLQTKGLQVPFSVRAHAWVAGQVPSRGHERQPHIDVSLSFSLPSSL